MSGGRSRVELGIFARAGRRIIFSVSGRCQADEQDLKPMRPEESLADDRQDGKCSGERRVPLQHTWLFELGVWAATGRFWEKGEIAREGRGISIVRHMDYIWVIEGTMEIFGEPPVRFRNDYRMRVPAPGARIVPWQSENPAIGMLEGVFVIVDEAIMSSFRSADGTAVGSEHLTWLAPDRYQARGLLVVSGNVASAWSMVLARQT